jgi:hypothetical protein
MHRGAGIDEGMGLALATGRHAFLWTDGLGVQALEANQLALHCTSSFVHQSRNPDSQNPNCAAMMSTVP